jgi:hypothetical protein
MKIKTFTVQHYANKQMWMITTAFIAFKLPSPEINSGSDLQTRVLHQSRYNYSGFDVLSVILRVTYIQCLAPKPVAASVTAKVTNVVCGQLCYSFMNKIVYYQPNYTCMLQHLVLSIIICFKQLYRKHQALEAVYLILRKEH